MNSLVPLLWNPDREGIDLWGDKGGLAIPDSVLFAPEGLKEKTGNSATDTGRRAPVALEKAEGAEGVGDARAGKMKSGRGLWPSLGPDTVVAMAGHDIRPSRRQRSASSIRNSCVLIHRINCNARKADGHG